MPLVLDRDHKGQNEVKWGNVEEISFFVILTNFQVEHFNQTHRVDLSWMERVIYIYVFAIKFNGQGV